MPRVATRALSGFADYNEAQNVALSRWLQIVENSYRLYGFSRLVPRPIEAREILFAQGGIQKQIFGVSRLPSDRPTDMALPFDRTVPLAHWVARHAHEVTFPYKRYDISYSFRGERAQAGRFQGFFQADVDIIGRDALDVSADAECIAVIAETLSQLGVAPIRVLIGHIALAGELLLDHGLPEGGLRAALDIVDKIGSVGLDSTREALVDAVALETSRAVAVCNLFSFRGDPEEFSQVWRPDSLRAQKAMAELLATWRNLVALGVPVATLQFCPAIVRGLDYYSGVVFETEWLGHEQVGSVASGGRYDDLASTFTSAKLPGVGGSIGLTRLFGAAIAAGLIPEGIRSEAVAFCGYRTESEKPSALTIAKALRQSGVAVDVFSGSGSVRRQLAYASRKGLQFAILAMGPNSFVIKDLDSGAQVDAPTVDSAVEDTLGRLRGAPGGAYPTALRRPQSS